MKKTILGIIIYILLGINTTNASNSEYYLLKDYDERENKAIVYSYITKKSYLLNLDFTHKSFRKNNYIGKKILIDKGEDFYIDRYDRFILNSNNYLKDIYINIIFIENIDNSFVFNDCRDEYGFFKYQCEEINIKKYNTDKITRNVTVFYSPDIYPAESPSIDEYKINKVFEKVKSKYKKSTDTTKNREYNAILKKLKSNQIENLHTLKVLEYMIYLINIELVGINNNNCDEISDMIGICNRID